MILRRAFLKRMATAALACAFLSDLPLPGLETAPEPIEEVCGECNGEQFIFVERPRQGIVSVAEYSYIPEPDGPTIERIACPSCNSPWKKIDGDKDAFEAYMTSYSQVMVKRMEVEQRRMIYGIEA